MGVWLKNIRAFWNDLGDKFTDPAKAAALDVADLERALEKTKMAQAEIIGQPARLRSEISILEKKRDSLDNRLRDLGRVGTEESRNLARKPALELQEILRKLEGLREELQDAEEGAAEAKAHVEMYESILREKRSEAGRIKREYQVANAEVDANKALNNLNGLVNGSSFDKYQEKVNRKKAQAAGMSELSGVSDLARERQLVRDSQADDILSQYFGNSGGE